MNIDQDELISESAAQGGEDFQVNYFAQNDFPSVELVVMGCPNASMRKRLDHVTKSAIKHASQAAGRLQTSSPSDHAASSITFIHIHTMVNTITSSRR